jgi:hypothetical protein
MPANNEDQVCKHCSHPISLHTMTRAEKRAQREGTMISDYPGSSGGRYNIFANAIDAACSDADCSCEWFLSPCA